MSYELLTNDSKGREGVLTIDGENLPTPNFVPTATEYGYMRSSPFMDAEYYSGIKVGTCTQWLSASQIYDLMRRDGYYQIMRSMIRAKMSILEQGGVEKKLVHFEFNADVKGLDAATLKALLGLQYEAGADVLEVPNVLDSNWDYGRVVDDCAAWARSKDIDTPLKGIACSMEDVALLSQKLDVVESVGLNLRRENFPMLIATEELLKPLDVWVHAFSVPRLYPSIRHLGTLGVFINSFGVDTFSTRVIPPASSRGIHRDMAKMDEDEKSQKAETVKFFTPQDYAAPRLDALLLQDGDGGEHKLSRYCDCSMCKRYTIENLLFEYESTYASARSHEVLAHRNEARIFRDKIRNNETGDYLASKAYAKRIIDRALTPRSSGRRR